MHDGPFRENVVRMIRRSKVIWRDDRREGYNWDIQVTRDVGSVVGVNSLKDKARFRVFCVLSLKKIWKAEYF